MGCAELFEHPNIPLDVIIPHPITAFVFLFLVRKKAQDLVYFIFISSCKLSFDRPMILNGWNKDSHV